MLNTMKKITMVTLSLMLGLFLMMSTEIKAQDATKAASNVYKKVLLDNEKVRVLHVEFAPGDVAAWHSHPNHVVYALTDGQLEITDKGKTPQVMDIHAGDAMYLPAVTHMARNTGSTTMKLIVTEMKPTISKKVVTTKTKTTEEKN
jgi:beta-alanine degradation protein BauB